MYNFTSTYNSNAANTVQCYDCSTNDLYSTSDIVGSCVPKKTVELVRSVLFEMDKIPLSGLAYRQLGHIAPHLIRDCVVLIRISATCEGEL